MIALGVHAPNCTKSGLRACRTTLLPTPTPLSRPELSTTARRRLVSSPRWCQGQGSSTEASVAAAEDLVYLLNVLGGLGVGRNLLRLGGPGNYRAYRGVA